MKPQKSFFTFVLLSTMLFAACDPQGSEAGKHADKYNLSAAGTSNCYIVTDAGIYHFDATVKGNGVITKDVTSAKLAPVNAKLVWEDHLGLVSNVRIEKGNLYFKSSGKEGNAVVAATDAEDNVIWSWHLWFTGYDHNSVEGQIAFDGNIFMDRYLGALTDIYDREGTVKGLFYQWGRKDPFVPGLEWFDLEPTFYNGKGEQVSLQIEVVSEDHNLENSIRHPEIFYSGIQNPNGDPEDFEPFDWYTATDVNLQNNFLWNTEDNSKTLFDPCPAGWRVPSAGAWDKFNARNLKWIEREDEEGYYAGADHREAGFWAAAGFRGGNSGVLFATGYILSVWTCTPSTEYPAYASRLYCMPGSTLPDGREYRASAMPVRCVKE